MTYLCTVEEMIVCLVKLCLKEAFQFFCCYNHIRNEFFLLFSKKNRISKIVWLLLEGALVRISLSLF